MADIAGIQGKRVTLKRRRPNPLFEAWLEELHEEARAKKSKIESMLKQALESISKYPLPLETGADCLMLQGFDRKLCAFLDRHLEVYNSPESDPESTSSQGSSNVIYIKIEDSLVKRKCKPEPKTTDNDIENVANSQSNSGTAFNGTVTKKAKPKSKTSDNNVASANANSQSNTSSVSLPTSSKGPKSRKTYKPPFRSGSYAILIALLEQMRGDPMKPSLKKEELILKAQPHSEESFTRPKPDSFYTAWSSISLLVKKGLVSQVRHRTIYYSLTDEGIVLAKKLLEEYKNRPTVNDLIFNDGSTSRNRFEVDSNTNSQKSVQGSQETVTSISASQRTISGGTIVDMEARLFQVILLIDKQETSGVQNKRDPTVAQFKKYPDLKHEYRSLKVGDFTWVARSDANPDQEIILPYIVERKRMDDLGHSIKDGRFHEQKFRLRKCGVPNVIYLVEHFGSKHLGLPMSSLMQALANTRVQDGFKVHITASLTDSVRFLAMMTKRLTIEYKDKSLIGSNAEPQGDMLMIFSYFNKSSMKNKPLTVTETFIKLLLQLKGVSVEKALAITNVYKTPKTLIEMYKCCSKKNGEALLSNLKYGELSRNVGPTVSKAVYNFLVWKSQKVESNDTEVDGD